MVVFYGAVGTVRIALKHTPQSTHYNIALVGRQSVPLCNGAVQPRLTTFSIDTPDTEGQLQNQLTLTTLKYPPMMTIKYDVCTFGSQF